VAFDFSGKAEALKKVEELRQKIIAGQIVVPRTPGAIVAAGH
jgi:basic membrane lipoprotein Med (substrate-binding protein (PBP1-ABC) superfamily)